MHKMKFKLRLFWLWLAIKEIFRNGRTDYRILSLLVGRMPK
ncbi:MAG: hypothetical protein ACOCQX_04825 [Candidatus Nanoarchaeia archaeon]